MPTWHRSLRRVPTLVLVTLVALTLLAPAARAGQGSGDPRLSISTSTLDPNRVSTVTVTGTDYLVPPYAEGATVFGGVYVLFGWVKDPARFGPSVRNSGNNDGTFGVSYLYPGDGGDANMRDDGTGSIRLVAFTPGGETGDATDFHMDRDGNWSTTMRVYGSTFSAEDPRTGETHTVDCTAVRCGFFTLGAHGKASSTNEKFIPVTFQGTPTTTTTTTSSTTTTVPQVTSTTAPAAPSTTVAAGGTPDTTQTTPPTDTTVAAATDTTPDATSPTVVGVVDEPASTPSTTVAAGTIVLAAGDVESVGGGGALIVLGVALVVAAVFFIVVRRRGRAGETRIE